jgi:hypothetical protein
MEPDILSKIFFLPGSKGTAFVSIQAPLAAVVVAKISHGRVTAYMRVVYRLRFVLVHPSLHVMLHDYALLDYSVSTPSLSSVSVLFLLLLLLSPIPFFVKTASRCSPKNVNLRWRQ